MSGETTPCVEYEGTRNADGYGILPKPVHGSRLAHRAALAVKLGRPVEGVSRHTCDNPPCVNLDHLIEGSQAENMADAAARGRSRGGRHDQTHCIRQHEMTEENTRMKPNPKCRSGYERKCRACGTMESQQLAAKRKAARAGQLVGV